MKKKRRSRAITLIEIMIVMVIIGLIASVFIFNMKGSMDDGKAFKTEQGSRQIQEVLALQMNRGAERSDVISNPAQHLKESQLIQDPNSLLKDGWGNPYEIYINDNDDIFVRSSRFLDYIGKRKHLSDDELKNRYSWMFPEGNCDQA